MSGCAKFVAPLLARLGVVLTLVAGLLVAAPGANAAVARPGGLSPSATTVDANPVLSWARVSAAVSYDVEVSKSSDFASLLYEITTTNNRATPTNQLPMQQIWWRVRTRTAAGVSPWSVASFTRRQHTGPELTDYWNNHPDGVVLPQPSSPPLLRWKPITGATSYTVEVDRGATADWVDSITYNTQTTSLVVPDPQEDGKYFWRVRAELGSGQLTQFSSERTYTIGGLRDVTNEAPANGKDVEEVVLTWAPVPGAASYDIRVSTDSSFSEGTIVEERVVTGTRYSPVRTYAPDDYWWQVRARNIFGKAKEWYEIEEKHQFTRIWEAGRAVPALLHPADAVSPPVGDDFYYQWTPARLAARYRLDLGTDINFSPGTFKSCFTTQTTYTPGFSNHAAGDNCMPSIGVTYYWRVKALDGLDGTRDERQGVYSETRRFVYSPQSVKQVAPVTGPDGAIPTVDVPTLRWGPPTPAHDAVKYLVQISWQDGTRSRSISATTYSTSWTPTGTVRLDPAKGPYTWTVQSVDQHGTKSPLPAFGGGEKFNVSGDLPVTGETPLTPLTPIPGGSLTTRFPSLTWEPDPRAVYYKVWVGTAGSDFIYPLNKTFPYPAATDESLDHLAAGDYDWYVRAYDDSGTQLANPVSKGTFTIADLEAVGGQRIALDASGFASPTTSCSVSFAATGSICKGMKATPVLDWDPVPDAGYYMIYVSRDPNFQNMVYGSYSNSTTIPYTTNTMFSPTVALPDSQAGIAYYWYIRPCKAPGTCAPDPRRASHGFDKTSNPVVTTEPALDGSLAPPQVDTNAITFSWEDYLSTNQSGRAGTVSSTGEKPGQAARAYYVEVSTSRAFGTLVDKRTVDQTTYTAFDRMYPEGQLFWRVRAIDGAGNELPWSDTGEFTKSSPRPTPAGPAGNAPATEPFEWQPANFAKSYDLEVYKDGDTAASSTNRVLSVNSKQVAYSLAKPLPAGTTYVWRVRRVDYSNNDGEWEQWRTFTVAPPSQSLTSPGSGAWLRPNDALFTWPATAEATTYLYERRLVGSTRTTESVKTASTGWAPYRSITTGSWEWRVSSLDAAGKVLSSSEWRRFYVDATAPKVLTVSPSGYAVKPGATFKIKFDERVKNVSGTTVRIFKDGVRKKVRARVTISRDRRTAILNPRVTLKRRTYYTIKLSGAVTDMRGNRLVAYNKRIKTR